MPISHKQQRPEALTQALIGLVIAIGVLLASPLLVVLWLADIAKRLRRPRPFHKPDSRMRRHRPVRRAAQRGGRAIHRQGNDTRGVRG